jgi:hypothetical protein
MNITPDHLRILVALSDASALRREPKPLTPDGHERWFSLVDLAQEGRLPSENGFTSDGLCAAARSLRKHTPYVAGRTLHTVVYYSLTAEGRVFLSALEDEAGVSGLVAAEQELEQAEHDMRQVTDRYHAARAAHIAARRAAGVRGSINVLLDAMKETAR